MNITKELAELQRLGMNDLRARYAQVFGEPSRSGNRAFLTKRILWRLQSQAQGTLSERALRRARELADESYLRTTIPPTPTTPTTPKPLPLGVADREIVYDAPAPTGVPTPGSTLVREYKGRTIRVNVLRDGFEWAGDVYKSLTAVAKAVTGSHWNGHLFFGIEKPESQKNRRGQ